MSVRSTLGAVKLTSLAAVCLAACGVPGLAAPPAPVIDGWAGPYIGAYFTAAAGGGATEATAQYFAIGNGTSRLTNAGPAGDITGSMVDLFVGRNWRFGNFVVGGQVEATISSNVSFSSTGKYTTSAFASDGTLNTVTTATSGTDPRLTFRAGLIGRAGFLARPNLLLYGLAGLEFGHFIFPDDDDNFGTANRSFAVGYTAGAGVEARVDRNWSVRAEYRYLHFGTGRWESTGFAPQNFTTGRYDNINMQVGKLGLVYRFGDDGPLTAMAAMPRSSQRVWADSWAGPYAGIYFGARAGHVAEAYSASSVSTSVSPNNFPPPPTTTRIVGTTSAAPFAGNVNGSTNELFLGYNWRNGKFVAGVQAEGTLFGDVGWKANGPLSASTTITVNGVGGPIGPTINPAASRQLLRSEIGLIGRAGFLATTDLLLYGLGGVEFGNFVYATSRAGLGGANGKWVTGYTAGAGGEMRISDHWSLRGEYRYTHFDVERTESTPSSAISPPVNPTFTLNGTNAAGRASAVDFHAGKIGVVYKFEGAGPASAMAAVSSFVAAGWSDGWAGPYFGAYFGAGAGKTRGGFTETATGTNLLFPNTPTTVSNTNAALAGPMSGTQVDLFAGYNHRSGRFVVGGQIEASQFSDVAFKASGTETLVASNTTSIFYGTLDHSQRLRSMVGVVGRAGFLATPDLLLYGLGGVAFGHFTYPEGLGGIAEPDGKWVIGYTAGLGGEMKVARHWSLRGEYRYLHFDVGSGGSFVRNTGTSLGTDSQVYRTAADFHLGKVGLVYRIGDHPASAMAAMPGAREACYDRWTGFSAGIYGAAGMGRVQDTFTQVHQFGNLFPIPVPVSGASNDSAGTLAGDTKGGTIDLFAGYNWRAGQFVVGGQAEATVYADVGLKSRGTSVFVQTSLVNGQINGTSVSQSEFQQTLRSRAGLIARAGFLATPNLLLYGLAGAEFGHFAFLDGKDPTGGDDNKWVFGYTAGTGAELKLTDRWSLRGEYRYARFQFDRNVNEINNSVDPAFNSSSFSTTAGTTRTTADFHFARAGVAYNFCYCD